MLNIALLGSVVTRNALKLFSKDAVKVSLYLPKVSIASVCDKQQSDVILKIDDVSNEIFTKNIIDYDLYKNFFSDLNKYNIDILVIDFLDEEYDLLIDENKSHLLTKSNYLVKYELEKTLFKQYKTITHLSEKYMKYWKIGCDSFVQFVKGNNRINVCLLKVKFPEYVYIDHIKVPLTDSVLQKVQSANVRLNTLYEYFLSVITCKVIDVPIDYLGDFIVPTRGINLSNSADNYNKYVAKEIASFYHLDDALIYPASDRIKSAFDIFDSLLTLGDIPSISELVFQGKEYYEKGFYNEAKKCEKLIMILHNSHVPVSVKLGKGVSFGYGGIGTIIHADAKIGNYVVIGSNVTIGGGKSSIRDGSTVYVPVIEDRVYIATGVKILGGIIIGHHSIIGANAVVTKDIPPYSVVAGNPGKIINTITLDNFYNYISYLYKGMTPEHSKKLMFGD